MKSDATNDMEGEMRQVRERVREVKEKLNEQAAACTIRILVPKPACASQD